MKASEAVRTVLKCLADEPLIAATGFISRTAQAVRDRDANFYMIGSMGMASSIAQGLALARPAGKVVALDGDGAVLMNLGALATAGALRLRNFVHIVIDNASYESTGAQPSYTGRLKLERVAYSCGYRSSVRVASAAALAGAVRKALKTTGPSFILARVANDRRAPAARVRLKPDRITRRFIGCVNCCC